MKLSENEIQNRLNKFSKWAYKNNFLILDLEFKNFKEAMSYVNKVADIAEELDHHPDINIHDWNKVQLSVMTHSENGITEKDFQLLEKLHEFQVSSFKFQENI